MQEPSRNAQLDAQPTAQVHVLLESSAERRHWAPPLSGHGWTTARKRSTSTFA